MVDATPMKPLRGERNNNPGNIVYDPHREEQFLGELGLELAQPDTTEPLRFARFKPPELVNGVMIHYGIRAIGRVLRSYYERDGIPTLRGWIERWSPDDEVDAYVAEVASEIGVDPDKPFNQGAGPDQGDFCETARAIIHRENGRVIYPDVLIADSIGNAFT